MPKKRCTFTVSLQSKFSFLKNCEEIGKVFCTVCKAVFSIEHRGRSDIKQYIEKKKHTSALSSVSKSDKVTSYFIKQGPAGLTIEVGIFGRLNESNHLNRISLVIRSYQSFRSCIKYRSYH
jgi:hypothetical protein